MPSFTLSLTLSFIHSLIHSFTSLPSRTGSLSPSAPPTQARSSLSPAQHPTRKMSLHRGGSISPHSQNILFHFNFQAAELCSLHPGVRRICSPLRSRCSCNYCFDFHPLMPENSFLQHVVRQTLSLSRAHSAWDFRFQDGPDSWQPELEGSWTASLLRGFVTWGLGMSWRERQVWRAIDLMSQVRECERSGPTQGYGVRIHLDFGHCDDR